jgi:urocanate hydratase
MDKGAQENKLVVGSRENSLCRCRRRAKIASALIRLLPRGYWNHCSRTRPSRCFRNRPPYRETSNIYDGSRFTADMAIQNVIGDSFRGATWVSIHNGGGGMGRSN